MRLVEPRTALVIGNSYKYAGDFRLPEAEVDAREVAARLQALHFRSHQGEAAVAALKDANRTPSDADWLS